MRDPRKPDEPLVRLTGGRQQKLRLIGEANIRGQRQQRTLHSPRVRNKRRKWWFSPVREVRQEQSGSSRDLSLWTLPG